MRDERGQGMKLTLARIAEFISARGEFAAEEVALGYSIDSRTVGPGQLFFAVKGERLDGHDFVEQALENGAVAAVVRRDQLGRYPVKAALLAVAFLLWAANQYWPQARVATTTATFSSLSIRRRGAGCSRTSTRRTP